MNQFTLSNLPNGQELTFVKTREPLYNTNFSIDYRAYQRFVTDTGEQYYYVPQEFVAKGLTHQTPEGNTFVVAKPSLLDKNILNKAIPVVIPENALGAGIGEFQGALGEYANLYEKPTTGFLFKGDEDVIKAFGKKPSFWYVGDSFKTEGGGTSTEFSGRIIGVGEKDGQYVYLQEPREGASSVYLTSSGNHNSYRAPKRPGGLVGTFADFIADTPFLPEIVALAAAANPGTAPFAGEIYAASKGIKTAASGGELDDVLKSVATSYATAKIVPAVVKEVSPTTPGVYGGDVDVQPGGFYGDVPFGEVGPAAGVEIYPVGPSEVTTSTISGDVGPGPGVEVFPVAPPAPVTITPIEPSGLLSSAAENLLGGPAEVTTPTIPAPPPNYSLIDGANFPPAAEGMGGGTGITPGAAGEGLQLPTTPNIGAMGGGQGLLVPVAGGTVGALGFTPAGAVPILGDPGSFINNPDVLGQPVLAQGSPNPLISVQDALRGARLASNLLTPQQQQVPQQDIGNIPQGVVDYSTLLGLLAQRAGGTGLLGTRFQPQPINLASLLG